jgi:uncharacterized protein (DUF934 family)
MTVLMQLDGTAEAVDPFSPVGLDDELPAGGAIVIPHARWERDREALRTRAAPFGVRLGNTVDIDSLDAGVLEAALIVLEFPSFGDGRAYSQARLLRDSRGYRGRLRATGAAVVRDQLQGMARCGIDQFELRADQSVERCREALHEFTMAYQPARDTLPRVRELRLATRRT